MSIEITTDILRYAYAEGYFPMPHPETGEIEWYRPEPRAILPLDGFHCSKSLHKVIKKGEFRITFDEAFSEVMEGCRNRPDTWINDQFMQLYGQLHREGNAHSVEVWKARTLVGGTYGVSLGAAFFAESKFHTQTNASKVALYYLVQHLRLRNFELLEVQFLTDHLKSLGAIHIPDEEYQKRLKRAVKKKTTFL